MSIPRASALRGMPTVWSVALSGARSGIVATCMSAMLTTPISAATTISAQPARKN